VIRDAHQINMRGLARLGDVLADMPKAKADAVPWVRPGCEEKRGRVEALQHHAQISRGHSIAVD
jgi:hypothetical protein